ncbi:MAG TPA: hypothetical protein DEA82_10705 [Flavobacteriaceae bacterium]|nr:hypothetical protein [Flavobacteriaceae bacterium]MAY52946.1 hypothetical protein [Flavobacteriaceae bacterium]HBR54614.1 hypothetical protein [Flavobacteriaceae bacterium]
MYQSEICIFLFYFKRHQNTMAKSYSEVIQLNDSFEITKQKVEEALVKSRFKGSRWVEQQQAYYSETAVTLWSWGEDILVRLQKKDEGTEVQFSSTCKLATQIIDWGKNKKNATIFVSSLHGS